MWRTASAVREYTASRADADTDRAAHAGAAETAVAVGILRQVLLVIILGVIELRRGHDLGGDGAKPGGRQLLLERIARGFGRTLLRVVRIVDAGTILRADVVALARMPWVGS